jgi:hypothetical protein
MSDAIFQTTGQALHVAFLVMSQEARQDGPLRKALIQILEQQDTLTKRQREWMNQLIGQGSGTVNFSGLTSDEIRGQCAMITQSVRDQLMAPERYAVIGAYTHMPLEKAEAVRYLSDYIMVNADGRKRLLYDYCVLKCTSRQGNENLRSQDVLAGLGVTDKSAAAHLREIRKKYNLLRERGERNLNTLFLQHGVVNAD